MVNFYTKAMAIEDGFTLVEISIVLVITGLIVGGVLVGQDMIRAAEIRATVRQLENFNSAVFTFYNKYNSYPGDMLPVKAAMFGFAVRNGDGGKGDGDGLIEGCEEGGDDFGCENKLFWRDLNQAGLISSNTTTGSNSRGGGSTVTNGSAGSLITTEDLHNYLPEAAIGGNYIMIFANNYVGALQNWYEISRVTAISGSGVYTLEKGMTPQTAYQIDSKIDDGLPLTGLTRATLSKSILGYVGFASSTSSDVGTCMAGDTITTDTDDPYNTSTDDKANTLACQIMMKALF